jgi:hypothetical protein
MNAKEEGLLRDYISIGVIGFAIGTAIASVGGYDVVALPGWYGIDWGRTAGQNVISGIFAYMPAAAIATYLSHKMNTTENKMEGLTVGLMVFIIHLFITLFMTIGRRAINGSNLGVGMQLWGFSLVFALIFYLLGGFLSIMLVGLRMPMPGIFRFQRTPSAPAPPPPPGMAGQTCPTCGGPLRYIQQYQRWYCDKEQKYV